MKLLHVIANNFKNFNDSFEIDFYHDRFIYRYKTIKNADSIASKSIFMMQRLCKKKCYKSKGKDLYNDKDPLPPVPR